MGSEMCIRDRFSMSSPDAELLALWSGKLVHALSQLPELTDVASDLQDKGLQVYLVIDRDAASRLGVSVSTITDALYDAFGQRQISTIYTQASQYRVVLQAQSGETLGPAALNQIHVKPLTVVRYGCRAWPMWNSARRNWQLPISASSRR